ncbi:MAG: hypothetical protein LC733_06045, partial [Actinobacteria bacterium]|nr:hypothetical protein [Actinomycetota bacterium]
MILLVFLLVLLVAGAGAGLLGIGVLSDDRRRERSGLAAVLSAPVVLAGGVVVLVAVVALGSVGPQSGGDPPPEPASTTTTPGPLRTDTTRALPFARLVQVTADIPVIRIEPATEERFSPYRPVSGLTPGSVVRVLAEGFDWHERGRVEQCVIELGRQTACAEAFPVQFDDRGRAD